MLKPTTTPPQYISYEDHQSLTTSTPASFVDIPPVLAWSDEVEVILTPSGSWGWEGRIKGRMWVTEGVVVFIPSSGSQGFELPYPSLTLHALTPASGDQEAHLYCQIDDSDAGPTASSATAGTADIRVESNGQQNGQGNGNEMDQDGNGNDDEDDGGEYENEGEYDEMKELKVFVGEGKLQPLFTALSSCSALHASLLPSGEPSSFPFFPPDTDGEFDDAEGDEDEAWIDVDGQDGDDAEGGQGGRAVSANLSSQKNPVGSGRTTDTMADGKGEEDGDKDEIDPIDRFLGLVQWGNVKKPDGWDLEPDAIEDAEEEQLGAVDDLDEVVKAVAGLDVAKI